MNNDLNQSEEVKARFAKLRKQPVVFEVRGLGKEFMGDNGPRRILKDISFKVYHRELLSIIGPSGCGKSTLVRMLACLEDCTEGEMLLNDHPVYEPGPDRGMVFQKYTLFPWLTVRKNVMFGLTQGGMGKFDADCEARQWLEIVGLEAYANLYPAQLSGGMQQRVAIARALANRPKVLLMDEPFGALDAQTRAKMQAYLLQIREKIDITIIFITHDLDEAVYLSDRILALKADPGEVVEIVEVPLSRPRTPAQFQTPEFLAARDHIAELIHPHPAPVETKDDFKIIQMAVKEN